MTGPVVENAFIRWDEALAPSDLDFIEAHGDALLLQKAQLGQPSTRNYDHVRVTSIAWIEFNAETRAFYEKLGRLVQHLNQHFYRFDISGLENLQYTVYRGDEGSHYDWHLDYGPHNPKPRKISLSLQLSDEAGYDGCDLEFLAGNDLCTAPRRRGTLIAFPSFFMHRVTPISRGTRKSLVCWVAGPAFR